jgi:glutathione S-transferase
MAFTLYGTLTSPYVRRVRAVAHELGVAIERVDTRDDDGQGQLRAMNPLWRVPTARDGEQMIFDSRVIVDHLVRTHGAGRLSAPGPGDLETLNRLTVIDGALDTLINVFYLERDGYTADDGTYLAKQRARAAASLAWLEAHVDDVWITRAREFGLPEIALVTAVGWMRFREAIDLAPYPGLVRCLDHHGARPSLAETRPPA